MHVYSEVCSTLANGAYLQVSVERMAPSIFTWAEMNMSCKGQISCGELLSKTP